MASKQPRFEEIGLPNNLPGWRLGGAKGAGKPPSWEIGRKEERRKKKEREEGKNKGEFEDLKTEGISTCPDPTRRWDFTEFLKH